MNLVAASDLHLNEDCRTAVLRQAEAADLVILAGDFAQRHEGLAEYMAPFEAIADKLILVPGNNETPEALAAASTATLLNGSATARSGLTIAGIGAAIPPITPPGWASYNLDEADAAAMLGPITQADILISHSPPKGVGDHHHVAGSIGSTAIRDAAIRLAPRILLCGHVHDCWGARGRIGETLVANLGPVPVTFEL